MEIIPEEGLLEMPVEKMTQEELQRFIPLMQAKIEEQLELRNELQAELLEVKRQFEEAVRAKDSVKLSQLQQQIKDL